MVKVEQVRTVINCPAEKVWKVISTFQYDFSTNVMYVKWDGDYRQANATGLYKFRVSEGKDKEGSVVRREFVDGEQISWGAMKGPGGCIADVFREFVIKRNDDNSCTFIHQVSASGLISYIAPASIYESVGGFNNDLKKYVESM